MQEALAAQRRRQLDVAARLYEKVIARAPLTFDAVHMLGVVRLEQGELEHAEALLARALDLMPGLDAIRQNIGVLELRKREYRGLDSARETIAYDMLHLFGFEQRKRRRPHARSFPIADEATPDSVVHIVVPGDASNAASNRNGLALFRKLARTRTTLLWTDPGDARWIAPLPQARKIDAETDLVPNSGTLALFGLASPTLQWLPHRAEGFETIVLGIDVQDPVRCVELIEALSFTARERLRIVTRSPEALDELGLPGTYDSMVFDGVRVSDRRANEARQRVGVFLPAARDGHDGERWEVLEWLRQQKQFLRLLYPGRIPSPHVPFEEEHLVSLATDWDEWWRDLDALVFWGAGGRQRQFDLMVFEAVAAGLCVVADGFGDYTSALAESANCQLFFNSVELRRSVRELLQLEARRPQ
jgi:hypothetical protein